MIKKSSSKKILHSRKSLKKTCFQKITAGILLLAFTLQSTVDVSAFQFPVQEAHSEAFFELNLAPSLGTVKAVSLPKGAADTSFPLIIHIQDAHGVLAAQRSTEKILKYLWDVYQIRNFYLEGASGPLSPERFRFFSDKNKNEKIWKELFKRRILNGADLHLLKSDGRITGFGVEEEEVYRENLRLFREVAATQPVTSAFALHLYQRLETLATHLLSKDGQTLLRAYWKFRRKEMPVSDFVRLLAEKAKKYECLHSVIRKEQVQWPNLSRLIYLGEAKGESDPGRLIQDKERFIHELKAKNISPDLLAKVSEIEKEKDIRFLFGRLYDETRSNPFLAETYPDLMRWAKLRILSREIEPQGLFEETERLGTRLLARLAKTRDAKKLVYVFRKVCILQDLFQLSLVRSDWKKIDKNRKSFSPLMLTEMTGKISGERVGHPIVPVFESANAGKVFAQTLRFYECAQQRDRILARNTLQTIKRGEVRRAVLITGGFHSAGLAEKFREAGIGYVEIEPAIKGEISSEDYFARIQQKSADSSRHHLAIPDALQDRGILERLDGEGDFIRRAVWEVLEKQEVSSEGDAVSDQDFPKMKAASLGEGEGAEEKPIQIFHFWDIGAQFENGIGQSRAFPEGEVIVLRIKTPIGLRDRITRVSTYSSDLEVNGTAFKKVGQDGNFDVWEMRLENLRMGTYSFMPFIEIHEPDKILRFWTGNPGENFVAQINRRLFEDVHVQFENGIRKVVTVTPDGEILLRIRTPVGLRERINRVAVETELPGQDGLEFERKGRDGDFDVWEARLKAVTTGGYLFLPYLEMKEGDRIFTYWAGHDWQKSSVRVFPAWATEGLNMGISFIKTLRRPGTSQERSGTFTDLMWYLKDLKGNPDLGKRIDVNAVMLLPFTDSFTHSPYEAISPFAINPSYIDWERVPFEGGTPEEKFETFKRMMRDDPEFQKFLKSPAFQDIRNYADTKAIYGLRTDEGKDLPSEDVRDQARQTPEYSRLVGSKERGDGFYIFEQYIALMQLKETIAFAHQMGVRLFFDLPFFQNDQGAWAIHHPDYFEWENGKVRNPVYDKLGGRDQQTWHGQGYWDYTRIRELDYEPVIRIFRYWVDLGFDGFRWDAAHMSAPEVRRAVNEKIYRGRDILPITEQLGGTDDDAHDLARNGFMLYRSIEYPAKGGLGGLEAQLMWTAGDYHFGQNTMHDTPRVPFAFKAITCADGSLEEERVTTVAVQRLVNYTQEIGLFLQGDEWGQGGPNPNDMRYNEAGNSLWHWEVPSPMDSSGQRYDIRGDIGTIFRVRNEHPVFSKPGTLVFLRNSNWPNVSSFLRKSEEETVLVVINVTPRPQEGSVYFDDKTNFERLGLPRDRPFTLTHLETGERTEFVPGQNFSAEENAVRFRLEPGQAYVFSLSEIAARTASSLGETPVENLRQDPFYQALAQGYEKFISFDGSGSPAIYAGGRNTHFGDQEWGRDFAISLLGLIQMAANGESIDFPEGRKSARELSRELIRRWAGIDPEGRVGMDPDRRKRIDGKNPDGDIMYNVINWYGGFNRNTVDAPLWFVEAVFKYIEATKDYGLLKETMREGQTLLDVLREIVDRYRMSGEDLARNGIAGRSIQMDPATGFILAPREKYTWMDTEFTPRQGYPVEIQALWYNALICTADLTERFEPDQTQPIGELRVLADRVKRNFPDYFWNSQDNCLHDILGTEGVMTPAESVQKGWVDPAVRPNQLFAVLFGLVEGEKAKAVLGAIREKLLIPGALRSLAPGATPFAVYRHDFEIPEREGLNKNAAYHNGLGWVWLYPFYFLAAVKNGVMSSEDAEAQMRKNLEPILQYNPQRSLPELLSGDPYDGIHARRGPDAQAWSVATAIAVLHQLRSVSAGASLGGELNVRNRESRSVTKLADLPDDDRVRIVQGDPGSYFSLTTGQVYFPRDKGIRPIKIDLGKFPPGSNFFAVYRGRKLISIRQGFFEPAPGKGLKDYPVVWKRKILSTPGEIDAFVTKQGLRELFALGSERPGELKQLLAYFLRGSDLTLEELEKLIWGFRSLHLGEVTRFHGFPDRGLNFVDVFLKTLFEKAALFANLDEKDQEVIIRVFINWVYKEYRKDPEAKIRQLEARIGQSTIPLLNRLKERVRDEFLVAAAFQPAHIKTRLEPHEAIGAYRLKQHDRYALLDGARVGKTIQALAALDMSDRTLIVSPAGVIDTWLEEERKSFSDRLDVEFVSADSSANEIQEAIGRLNETDRQAVVVLRGLPANRRQLLEVIRGRKNTIIHISYETLRQMNDEELGVLQEALDGIILDEWQYAENFVSGESRLNAQQAFAVQKINPKKKWILTATPYRTDPHKLYALFH